ncbi:unnamed protein product [Schistosoma mattheei]|uniref:Uncharacterized protein n=1 Tax=Schistosoma mattheei TaxID=31246 RepID=A0A3P8EY11_9TREM|nr:unnamed protein product [Schistosoma mattheei]
MVEDKFDIALVQSVVRDFCILFTLVEVFFDEPRRHDPIGNGWTFLPFVRYFTIRLTNSDRNTNKSKSFIVELTSTEADSLHNSENKLP